MVATVRRLLLLAPCRVVGRAPGRVLRLALWCALCSAVPAVQAGAEPDDPHAIPGAATAVPGDEIDRRGLWTLYDVARWTPGLAVTALGPHGGDAYGGPPPRSTRHLGAGTPAYWGEIPIAFDPRLHDMERVEVQPGPRSVRYGLGAMAGAVRYVPRRPDPKQLAFQLRGGGFMRGRSDGAGGDLGLTANMPLADRKLALRASFGFYRDPGLIDYDHLLRDPGTSHTQPAADAATHLRQGADTDSGRTLSARLALLWQPTAAIEVLLSHQTQDMHAGGYRANHLRAYGTGRYESGSRYPEPVDRTDRLWSLEAGWDMGPAKLTTVLGYTEWAATGQRDQTDLLLRYFGIDGLLPDNPASADLTARPCDSADPSPFCGFSAYTRDEDDVKALHGSLRLASTGDGPWGWMAGVSWRSRESEGSSREFAPGLSEAAGTDPAVPMDLEYHSRGGSLVTQNGVFGTLSRRLGERWRLFAGLRRFEVKRKNSNITEFPFTPNFNRPYSVVRSSHDGILYSAGASFRFGGGLAYAVRSEGRSTSTGGVNNFPVCTAEQIAAGEAGQQPSCIYQSQQRIEPDSTINYEVGLRGAWFGGRLAASGALFQTEWRDAQIGGRTPFSKQQVTLNADARSRGAELALAVRPDDALLLRGFWSYARAELTQDTPGLLPDGADAFKGDRMAGAPEHRGGLIATWTRRVYDNLLLDLSYDVSWTGSVLTRIGEREGGERLSGYDIHGLSLSLTNKPSSWRATLYVDNLFDRYAVTTVAGTPRDILAVDGFDVRSYTAYTLPTRQVGLRFLASF